MYAELINRLMACKDDCSRCPMMYDEQVEQDLVSEHCAAYEAADAIEFLQTYKVCFDNIVSMGGWWLVGQDKNLYRMDVPMNWPPTGTKTVEIFPFQEPPKEET